MRVGIYDPYLDDVGGGEKYMMTIAECLTKEHMVTVFWDHKQDVKKIEERFSLDLNKVRIESNIFSPKVSFWKRLWQTRKYDAIIFLSDGSMPFTLAKKLFLHIQQPLTSLIGFSWKDTTKLSLIGAVFYNSVFTKSFNESKFPGVKSFVLYPPVALFPKNIKKENIILHVGRFRVNTVAGVGDYKKQGVMIEAFKHMVDKKQVENWKFVMAVSVQDKDMKEFTTMQQSAKGYSIEFLVNKKNKDLWDVYNKAKLYWHASGYGEDLEKHPEYAEHFGISTVEAMGAGAVPVVISAGGQAEIVEDGVNGFLWNSLEELAGKTSLLMRDSVLWKKMSEQAKIRAKEFSKERFCNEISKLISAKEERDV